MAENFFPPLQTEYTEKSIVMEAALKNLRKWLIGLLRGGISERDITLLVQFSRLLVQTHLQHSPHALPLLSSAVGIDMKDMAMDCLAEVFSRDGQGNFYKIENFINSLRDEIDRIPEAELFAAYKGFLIRLADANLAVLYGENDPAGKKIYRNVREFLRDGKLFSIGRDFRGLVLYPAGAEALDHLPAFPQEELQQRFYEQRDGQFTICALLRILYDVLTSQKQFRRSVTLYQTMMLFRGIYQYVETVTLSDDAVACYRDELSPFEVYDLCRNVLEVMKEKIAVAYYLKGKVTREEAGAMLHAFRDLLADYGKGEQDNGNLFDYLSRYLDIDKESYDNGYRTRMEYLFKIAREELGKRLIREL